MRQADNNRFKKFCEQNQTPPDLYLQPNEVNAYYFRKGADSNVCIDYQDASTSDGIPFTTFHDIVTRQERVDDLLHNLSPTKH